MDNFSKSFLTQSIQTIDAIDPIEIEKLVDGFVALRQKKGRLFICGMGGSAANASHAVNDFRKLAGIEAYSPTDSVSELSARANDEGLDTIFSGYLKSSNMTSNDALLILSVGGGSEVPPVSTSLITAMKYAKQLNAPIFAIVGRDGGFSNQIGNHVLVVPNLYPAHVTPICESLTVLIWHLIVSHPKLKLHPTKW
jgi:D-sedoheptulose 7-phosphate isomerase